MAQVKEFLWYQKDRGISEVEQGIITDEGQWDFNCIKWMEALRGNSQIWLRITVIPFSLSRFKLLETNFSGFVLVRQRNCTSFGWREIWNDDNLQAICIYIEIIENEYHEDSTWLWLAATDGPWKRSSRQGGGGGVYSRTISLKWGTLIQGGTSKRGRLSHHVVKITK